MMSILDKLIHLALFSQPQNKIDESEDYLTKFESLHRKGLSDEEWEAKKLENPGLFAVPRANHVGKTKEESRLSEILSQKDLSDEEWEAKKLENPGYFFKLDSNADFLHCIHNDDVKLEKK